MYCHVCAHCISQTTASTVTRIACIIRRIKTSPAKKISQEKVPREHQTMNPIEYILECINIIYSIKHKNGAIRRANVNLASATETRRMGLNLFRQVAQGPRRQSAHKGRGVYRASMKKDSGIFVFRSYL